MVDKVQVQVVVKENLAFLTLRCRGSIKGNVARVFHTICNLYEYIECYL